MCKGKSKTIFIIVGAALVAILAGCATTQGLAQQQGVKLESVDSSSSVRITRTYLDATEEATIILRRELERRIPSRSSIPGHLHVELIAPDGKVMKEANIDYVRNSFKSRLANFSLPIPEPLVTGSTIRVTHHDARSHMSDSSASPWQDVNSDKE